MRRLSLLAVSALVVACAGPILANPPARRPVPTLPPAPTPSTAADPVPIDLPRDEAPHGRLTEWWYYTGHLLSADGLRFGFEFVVFRAERGRFPVTVASHLAVTDEAGHRFHYAQRSQVGGATSAPAGEAPVEGDFSLEVGDGATEGDPWLLAVEGDETAIVAAAPADETSTATELVLHLQLTAIRPAVLHDGDGWIDFGPAGGSYYYSRTRLDATGILGLGGRELEVTGSAWFDHQWGDFISVGGAGWDWFAVNLADGTDLTLSLVRDRDGGYPLVYGTMLTPGGETRHLPRDAFSVAATDRWKSARTGAEYPAGWRIEVPGQGLVVDLRPTVADQELDTRASTGVVYWEGSQVVQATRDGEPLGGEAYVELTGYAPAAVAGP